jgi:hypothetical protein
MNDWVKIKRVESTKNAKKEHEKATGKAVAHAVVG